MNQEFIDRAKDYAIRCHTETNHKYGDGMPYHVHLNHVVEVAERYIHLIPEDFRSNVIAACWLHDVIEDCRQTYNDVKNRTNEQVAELVYALTTEKGRNRKERADIRYYAGINSTPFAPFIKICDRMANYEYSVKNGSRMASVYEKEMDNFIYQFEITPYKQMLIDLKAMLKKSLVQPTPQ